MGLIIVLFISFLVFIGRFYSKANELKNQIESQDLDESIGKEEVTVFQPSKQPLTDLLKNLEEALHCIGEDLSKAKDDPSFPISFHGLFTQYVQSICNWGASTLKIAIEHDKVQSVIWKNEAVNFYIVAFPFQGDRPNLIRQTEGFSTGLGQHLMQVNEELLKTNQILTPSIFIALFYKATENIGSIYAGFHHKENWLLPRSLLNGSEISRFQKALSNFRRVI